MYSKVLADRVRVLILELQVHAYRFLGDWKRTEDMVMEAFSIACEKIDVFLESENRLGWMKLAVQNVCWNFLRRQNRENLSLIHI